MPNADDPWLTNAPKPVAGRMRLELPPAPPKPCDPNAESGLGATGVPNTELVPNMLFVFGLAVSPIPPSESPPSPVFVSISADIGSSELDMEIAIGDARDASAPVDGVRLPTKPSDGCPNFVGPVEAKAPNPAEITGLAPRAEFWPAPCPKA